MPMQQTWKATDDNATSAGATSGNATSRNATLGNVSYGSATGGDSRPWHYISEMQGAVSAIVGDFAVVWVSSCYGPIGDSHLHLVRSHILAGGGRSGGGAIDLVADEVKIFRFPPGLEDLYIERRTADDRYMWMVTEFGTRRVLATRLEYLLR
jgi:hypothetical protein